MLDSVPKPECFVGFESLGGGEGDVMFRGLWFRLRESSLIARAFPSLFGGEDCIAETRGTAGGCGHPRRVDGVNKGNSKKCFVNTAKQ